MYTKELIQEVLEVYPDNPKMHELAISGSVWLGRYLDDASGNGIMIKTVLDATSLKELQDEARRIERKLKLYIEWCKQDPRRISQKSTSPGHSG